MPKTQGVSFLSRGARQAGGFWQCVYVCAPLDDIVEYYFHWYEIITTGNQFEKKSDISVSCFDFYAT